MGSCEGAVESCAPEVAPGRASADNGPAVHKRVAGAIQRGRGVVGEDPGPGDG